MRQSDKTGGKNEARSAPGSAKGDNLSLEARLAGEEDNSLEDISVVSGSLDLGLTWGTVPDKSSGQTFSSTPKALFPPIISCPPRC
jgi:hypothetical protein